MIYNDFILAGITLEEISLIEECASYYDLEFSEDKGDLCLIHSSTDEVKYRGLSQIVDLVKKIQRERIDTINHPSTVDLVKSLDLISTMEYKLKCLKIA